MSVFDEESSLVMHKGDKSFEYGLGLNDTSIKSSAIVSPMIRSNKSLNTSLLHREKVQPISDPQSSLTKLKQENTALRTQLKELNDQIDTVINSVPIIKERSTAKLRDNRAKELENAKKRLDRYTKERKKLLQNREKLLNHTNIEELQKTIKDQMKTVSNYEKKVKKFRNDKINREKTLETVLDSGLTPDMAREQTDLVQENSIYQHKVAQLEHKLEKLTRYSKDLEQKHAKLTEEFNRLKAESDETPSSDFEASGKIKQIDEEYQVWIKSYNNRMSKLKIKVTQNERELINTTELISFYSAQLQKKAQITSKSTDLSKVKSGFLPPRVNLSLQSLNASLSTSKIYMTESQAPLEDIQDDIVAM